MTIQSALTDEELAFDRPVTQHDGDRWATLLEQIADILSRRAGSDYRPVWRSPASRELDDTAGERCPDGTSWGPRPCLTVWTAHTILMRTLVEHAHATAILLHAQPSAALPLETQARVLVELAAQASWLMWPGLSGRARVARLQVMRRSSAGHHDELAAILGLNVAADDPAGSIALDDYAHKLGLSSDVSRKGTWVGVEGQAALRFTARAAWFMEQIYKDPPRATYAYLCGAAHGELWRLVQSYRLTDDEDRWLRRPGWAFSRIAVMIAVEALIYAGRFSFEVLGLGAGMAELRAIATAARAEFAA